MIGPVHKSWEQCTERLNNLPEEEKEKEIEKGEGQGDIDLLCSRQPLSHANSSLDSLFIFVLDPGDQFLSKPVIFIQS